MFYTTYFAPSANGTLTLALGHYVVFHGEMSENMSIEQEEVVMSADIEVPPALAKEASLWVTKVLKDYTQVILQIEQEETTLKGLRAKKAELLKEHPWIGNVQGLINKEGFKAAKKSLTPPAPEPVSAAEPAEDNHEEQKVVQIPKKPPKRAAAQKRDLEAEKTRKNLLKKTTKLQEERNKSLSQFPAGHPAKE